MTGLTMHWQRVWPRIRHIVRFHWVILVFAGLLVGVELFSQQLMFHLQKYYVTSPVPGEPSSLAVRGMPRSRQDELLYYAQARRMFDGVFSGKTGDAFIYEYRDTIRPLPYATFLTVGAFSRLIGNPDLAFRLLKAAAMALTLLAVYLTAFKATRGKLSAVAVTFVTAYLPVIGEQLHALARGDVQIVSLVRILSDPLAAVPIHLFRVPFTGLTGCFVFLAIAAIAWAVRSPSKQSITSAGVLVGFQSLVYPYHTTTFALGIPVLVLWYAVLRDWRTVRTVMILGGIGAVLMIPALLQQWNVSHLPQYADYVDAIGVRTREFDMRMVFALGVAISLLVAGHFLRGAWQPTHTAAGALLIGACLSVNLHVVTGMEIQRWHWMLYLVYPLTVFVLCSACVMGVRRLVADRQMYDRWRRIAPVLAAGIIVFTGTKVVANRLMYARSIAPQAFLPADHLAAYRWLADRDSTGTVVCLSSEQIRLLPLLADKYSYLPMGAVSPVTYEETADRWVAACRIYGVSEEVFRDLLDGGGTRVLYNVLPPERSTEAPPWWFERTTIHEVLFHKRFRSVSNQSVPYAFPDSVRQDLLRRFNTVDDPAAALRRYNVDYIWQGPYERAVGAECLDSLQNTEPVYSEGRIRLYAF